jgi:hypothetical protein
VRTYTAVPENCPAPYLIAIHVSGARVSKPVNLPNMEIQHSQKGGVSAIAPDRSSTRREHDFAIADPPVYIYIYIYFATTKYCKNDGNPVISNYRLKQCCPTETNWLEVLRIVAKATQLRWLIQATMYGSCNFGR